MPPGNNKNNKNSKKIATAILKQTVLLINSRQNDIFAIAKNSKVIELSGIQHPKRKHQFLLVHIMKKKTGRFNARRFNVRTLTLCGAKLVRYTIDSLRFFKQFAERCPK